MLEDYKDEIDGDKVDYEYQQMKDQKAMENEKD